MANTDTINLLKECDAGTKMAVASIDEILDKVQDSKLEKLLSENKESHESLGDELHSMLLEADSDDKEPNSVAKSMSWFKTNMKMAMESSDATIADLITDGCDMGIKSLHRYQNQYASADETSKKVCKEIIQLEEDLRENLTNYL